MRRSHRVWAGAALLAVAMAALPGCGGGGDATAPAATEPSTPITGEMTLRTVSNRADMISGGNAMVEIALPAGAASTDFTVDLNGTDVSSAFAPQPGGKLLGVVTGLKAGENVLTASLKSRRKGATLTITNTDKSGNIFAGTPIQPWICATKAAVSTLVSVAGTSLSANVTTRVSGLEADPDANCNAPSKFTYYYQPKALQGTTCTFTITGANPCLQAYDVASRPADTAIADFTNDRGATVKALWRLELGTMGRSLYQIVVPFDPDKPWSAVAPQEGWNGKVHFKMGASASGNRFAQGPGTSVFDNNALGLGFMTVNSQLTNHNDNNNEFLATENIMMVKEHIVDTYGRIRFTMSDGGSGGSMMQTVPASVMPGLLDGLITGISYPDAVTTWIETRDCGALARYYQTTAGAGLTTAARASINGHPTATHCDRWNSSFVNPQSPSIATNCGAGFPSVLVYDPVLRPNGVRCSIHDVLTSIIGTVTDTDRNVKPNLPYDNAGVQYGLKSLRDGTISAEEFVALNEGIGSFTLDMTWTGGTVTAPVIPAPRSRVSPTAMPPMYKSGLVSYAKNLAKVPIIDNRPELGADIHMSWRSFMARARLDAANGGHANSIIRGSSGGTGAALTRQSFLLMNKWLTAMEADTSSDSKEVKVVRNKPADAVDYCITTNGATQDQLVDVGFTSAACPVKNYESPRIVSGGPVTEDVFKCQLKALDFTSADYNGVTFTTAQQNRLRAVFPDGVCDWTKPGVGQSAWEPTTFKAGPGGSPLPAAPVSAAF